MPRDEHPIVYSTEQGDLRKPAARPGQPAGHYQPPQPQTL